MLKTIGKILISALVIFGFWKLWKFYIPKEYFKGVLVATHKGKSIEWSNIYMDDENNEIKQIYADGVGNIYMLARFGAPFSNYETNTGYDYVAKWNGKKWDKLNGFISFNLNVESICSDRKGIVYAIGIFKKEGELGHREIFEWDGKKWKEFGLRGEADFYIKSFCIDTVGNLYVGGTDNNYTPIAKKWNGNRFHVIGSYDFFVRQNRPNTTKVVSFIHCDAFGNIYARIDEQIIKWDGYNWIELYGLDEHLSITSICNDVSGNIYVAGFDGSVTDYTTDDIRIEKWDGKNWSLLSWPKELVKRPFMFSICSDVKGNIYGGVVNKDGDSKQVYSIAKWDGKTWSLLDGLNKMSDVHPRFSKQNGIESIICDTTGNIYTLATFERKLK